ncbi:papilin [Nematostella vectensis]|uniref:papilin n=1 Tax=Nematostella vectensis TaxID=45351 RepID=UPI002076DC23|nr:papilin [Nematostella vectensis]
MKFCLRFFAVIVLFAVSLGEGEKCEDRFPCPIEYKQFCSSAKYRPFLERRCPKFCGYCKSEVDCSGSKYGCCSDGKTPAAGPNQQGCPSDEKCKDTGPCPEQYKKYCSSLQFRPFLERRCPKFCGFCKPYVDCSESAYGCCMDGQTTADGPDYKGCPQKMCYDRYVDLCKQYANESNCKPKDPEVLARRMEDCPFSCGNCKHFAPGLTCKDIGYGCCWDGTSALGEDKKGCRPCIDYYPHTCSQWGEEGCRSGSWRIRTGFMERFCPNTCGFCSKGLVAKRLALDQVIGSVAVSAEDETSPLYMDE